MESSEFFRTGAGLAAAATGGFEGAFAAGFAAGFDCAYTRTIFAKKASKRVDFFILQIYEFEVTLSRERLAVDS